MNRTLRSRDLAFQSREQVDATQKSSLGNLPYAAGELTAYLDRVERGEIAYDGEIVDQMRHAIKEAQYDYENGTGEAQAFAGGYFRTEEGQKLSAKLGESLVTVVEKTSGLSDPTGTVKNAAAEAAKVAVPLTADHSEKLMERAHETYTSEVVKDYQRTYILKDEGGNPITAAEGRERAFSSDATRDVPEDKKARFFEESRGSDGKEATPARSESRAKADFFEGEDKGTTSAVTPDKKVEQEHPYIPYQGR